VTPNPSSNVYPYGPSSQIQPYTLTLQAVAGQDSTASFTGFVTPVGQSFALTISCPLAPDTAELTPELNGQSLGVIRGGNTFGPVQILEGNQLTVTATGLIPGTTYYLTLTGIAYTSVVTLPVYPSAYSDSVTTSTEQIFLGSGTSTGGPPEIVTFSIAVQPLWRSLWVLVGETPPNHMFLSVVGATSGVNYPVTLDTSWFESFWRVQSLYGIDETLNITIENIDSGSFNYWYGADLAVNLLTISAISPGATINTYSNFSAASSATSVVTANLTSTQTSVVVLNQIPSGSTNFYYLKSMDLVAFYSSGAPVLVQVQINGEAISETAVVPNQSFTQILDNYVTTDQVSIAAASGIASGDSITAYLRWSAGT
jgi:hypothetical protein